MAKVKILLIEDETPIYKIIDWFITESKPEHPRLADVELAYSEDLSGGMEILKGGDVNVVLLDLNLPDSSGFDTFKTVYDAVDGIPVVILTGLGDKQLLSRCIAAGASSYLIKGDLNLPLIMSTVLAAIDA